MKRLCAWVLALLLGALLTLPAVATTYENSNYRLSLELPEEYILVENTTQSLEENEAFLNTLGYTAASFSGYLTDGNMLCFAANSDNTVQMQLRATSTDFTKEIQNLAGLSGDSFQSVVSQLVTTLSTETLDSLKKVIREDGSIFLQVQKTVTEDTAAYGYLQYITVKDGNLYILSYYNFGGTLTEAQLAEADTVFHSLTFAPVQQTTQESFTLFSAVYWVLIAGALALCIAMVVSIFLELHHRRQEDSNRIHRRKIR